MHRKSHKTYVPTSIKNSQLQKKMRSMSSQLQKGRSKSSQIQQRRRKKKIFDPRPDME